MFAFVVYNSLVRWYKLSLVQYSIEYSPLFVTSIASAYVFLRDKTIKTYYTKQGVYTGKGKEQ
jgi:hypothetical protein